MANIKRIEMPDGTIYNVYDENALHNIVDGSSAGSARGLNTAAESSSYTIGQNAFAIGNGTKASGKNSFASGQETTY